jgi:ATP-dependent Clp protease adaptor protein ClpS
MYIIEDFFNFNFCRDMSRRKREEDGDLATATKPETKRPKLYKVLLHNDDYTPMEFVTKVLTDVFNKNQDEATYIMLTVHTKGVGCCGAFPYSVAETKMTKVMNLAKQYGHPLLCTMEPE